MVSVLDASRSPGRAVADHCRPRTLASAVVAVAVLAPALMGLAAEPAGPAPGSARAPAVLFTGYPHTGCGAEVATRLHRDGWALNAGHHPGLEGPALTWEQVSKYNVLVVMGLGLSNADFTLTEKNRSNIEILNRFLAAGGGILFVPYWGQMATLVPPQEAFAAPLGLKPLFTEVAFDPETSTKATAWRLEFADSATVPADSPLGQGVGSVWYPVATRAGAQQHTTPLQCDASWTVVLRGGKGSFTRAVPLDSNQLEGAPNGSLSSDVPLVACRQVGKGRIVCLGISPEYLFSGVATTTLEGIVLDRGLRNTPSGGYQLVRNALGWLAAPSLAETALGGASMDQGLLANPHQTKFGQPFAWSETVTFPAANPAQAGVIGARTAFSTGKGSVAEWVTTAKSAGLTWLVFLEDFAALSPDEFAQLKRDCARETNARFAAIPGFAIDDQVGNHYFYFGTTFPYPEKKLLSADGKVFIAYDPELGPKDPHVPGQLAMTALTFAYSISSFRLTAGNYLFRDGAAPFAHFYSNWDAMAVLSLKNGQPLEDATREYFELVDAGQGPVPVVLDLLDAPDRLAASPWRTVLRLPDSGGSSVGDQLEGRSLVAAYWDQWHFYPDNPTRVYVTAGPEIENWSFAGPRDYEGNNRGDFVWQNLRWQVHGKVRSEAGLKEVKVLDGEALFRRFLPGAAKEFEFTLDLTHDKQHNLVLVVTDTQGQQAISGEQWDRNHRLEEFNCSDRNNQLSYGYLTNRDGIGLMIGGNQTLATPNKRLDDKAISPSGTFKNDGLLGAPAFDGGAGGEPVFVTPMILRTEAGEVHSPAVAQAVRLLHTGDVNIGEGRWTHNFTDGVRAANVWHSLWKTEPARDFIGRKRNHFFNIDPDSPLAVFLWTIEVKLLRDLPNRGILVGFPTSAESRLWAARSSDGTVLAGAWEESRRSATRTKALAFGPGAYAAVLDSPLGGAAIFSLTDGLEATLTLPVRQHRNFDLLLPAARTPQKAGETASLSLLIVGVPRITDLTAQLPASSTEVVERFWRDFGLGDGKPAYRLEPRAGTVVGQRYILDVSGTDTACLAGRLEGTLVSSLPITVSGLNDRWSAFLYDQAANRARPVGVFEGKAWAVVPLHGKADLFLGQPLTADQPELFIQVTQAGESGWQVEVHNPTEQALRATLVANPFFAPLAKAKLPAAPVEIAAGSSVSFRL